MFFQSLKGLAVMFAAVWLVYAALLYYWTGGKFELHKTWWLYAVTAVGFILSFVLEAIQVRHNQKLKEREEESAGANQK